MKILFVMLIVATSSAFGQQVVGRPFVIVISAETATVRAGKPIFIRSEVTNTSEGELNMSGGLDADTGVRTNHLFEIRDGAGHLLAQKPRKQVGPLTGGVTFENLRPQQSSGYTEDIGRAYDLSRPGKYEIQISRAIPGDPERVVKSNKIRVTVTP